jgi:hypothetical protein
LKPVIHPASFRDPSGFIFSCNDTFYRHVNSSYENDFIAFMQSGLYRSLIKSKLLISHEEVKENLSGHDTWYTTLLPEQLRYISYPFEWSYDMLKDAALTTLNAAKEALQFDMILKDASAYNIQFHDGKMTLIDSLSFEKYDGKSAWVAYRQFCEHFLAPLAYMSYFQSSSQYFLFANTEGLDLKLIKSILPFRSKFNLSILLHIHFHANFSNSRKQPRFAPNFSSSKLKQLLQNLEQSILSLKFSPPTTVWSRYYDEASQREGYLDNKKQIVFDWISTISAKTAIDLGANDGIFSEMLALQDIFTISSDNDGAVVNNLYNRIKKNNIKNIHPLLINLSNPTPQFGVNNEERQSFVQRTKVDLVLALAVIHHLAIGKNIPLIAISKFFSTLGKTLIVEFIPKTDEKISVMLTNRKDVFPNYTEEFFLKSFSSHFKVVKNEKIRESERKLYLMERI